MPKVYPEDSHELMAELKEKDTPVCACRNIKYEPRILSGGLLVDRWVCACCGQDFTKVLPKDVEGPECDHIGSMIPMPPDVSMFRWVCKRCGKVSKDGNEWEPQTVDDLPKTRTFMPSLEEANTIVNGERQDQYGAPEDSFEIIAGYWNVLLRQRIKDACNRYGLDVIDIPDLLTPLDSTNMMVLFKQARKLGQQPKRDNYIDSIGYEAIGADRLMKEANNG